MSEHYKKVTSNISPTLNFNLDVKVKQSEMIKSRMIELAIYNELQKENPFFLNTKIPDLSKYADQSFIDQGGKILNYLLLSGSTTGLALDLLILRHKDMGINSQEEFMHGFAELIKTKLVIEVEATIRSVHVTGTKLYVHCQLVKEKLSEKAKKASRYERYQKMKKEFGDD